MPSVMARNFVGSPKTNERNPKSGLGRVVWQLGSFSALKEVNVANSRPGPNVIKLFTALIYKRL
jgi:hypothetical protein